MTDEQKHPGGRPSKYDPAFCDQIIEHMREGASALSFAAEIGVSRATLNVWAEAHPEFLEALNAGKAACGAWWEKQGRAVAMSGGGNGQATMITFGLKNMGRDDWADRHSTELTGPDGGAIQTESRWVANLDDDTLAKIAAAQAVSGEK